MQRCLGCMRTFGDEFDVCPHCGYFVGTEAASKNHLAPGTVLQERYTLGKVLGQGGFGITYIAWDQKIGRAAAIKEYMPNALASRMTGEKEVSCFNEEAQRQFDLGLARTRRETHALSQFGALESVVKVHDYIEENKTAYIIMELLRGRTVREILKERGRLTFPETMRIMTPVLQTLDAMHKVGIIHRDVAPDNIFVCEDGKIKLLDFGAARVISGTDEKTLSVMLKAGYAPVEQYSSKAKQGAYTDVYAASATMYKMLTGETPPDSLVRAKDGSDLRTLSQIDTPQRAQETILHGMAQDANDRIGSAAELLDALQKDLSENIEGIDPRQFLREQKKKQTKKIARIVIAAALAACIVIGTAAVALHLKKKAEPTQSTQSEMQSATSDETDIAVAGQTDISTHAAGEDAAVERAGNEAVTPAYLRKSIETESKMNITEFFCLDYNGDGSMEAFAFVAPSEDELPEERDRMDYTQIWYANAEKAEYVEDVDTAFGEKNGSFMAMSSYTNHGTTTITINADGTKHAFVAGAGTGDGTRMKKLFIVDKNGNWKAANIFANNPDYGEFNMEWYTDYYPEHENGENWTLFKYGYFAGISTTVGQYLRFDEEKDAFIELGGMEITEAQFKRFPTASQAYDELESVNGTITHIYYRSNGCINVCFEYSYTTNHDGTPYEGGEKVKGCISLSSDGIDYGASAFSLIAEEEETATGEALPFGLTFTDRLSKQLRVEYPDKYPY